MTAPPLEERDVQVAAQAACIADAGGAAGVLRLDSFGGARSRYVFMVFALRAYVVWGASSTTCGSAPLTRRNPRLLRRADTAFAFTKSHTD